MNYTLHQLQVFLKIAETKSITRAAEQLHLTQPAVSIQLKNFQDQFEIPLTEIISRRIHITDFGQEIAYAAGKILNEVYAINFKTMAFKGLLSGKLQISSVSTGKYVIPYLLAPFIKKNEGIELSIDVTNKVSVLHTLEKNAVDFALVSIKPEKLETESIELMENELVLVASMPNNKKVKAKDLSAMQLIFREEGSATRRMMEDYLKKHGIKSARRLELGSNEAVKQAVMAGLGVSIMPVIGIRNELFLKQLHIIKAEGLPLKTRWQLVWPKNKKHSPAASAFLQYLRTNKEKIIRDSLNQLI
ncbi:MAG: LysR family transcriptional regulator [Bacteroidia bacterium]